MIKPGKLPKLTKEKLAHPKSEQRSKFQGDVIRAKEDQGFAERRKVNGCTVTHGTRPPSNVRPVNHSGHAAASPPLVREMMPVATTGELKEVLRPVKQQQGPPKELTPRQKKMTKGKG